MSLEQPQEPELPRQDSPFRTYVKQGMIGLALAATLVPLTSCGGGSSGPVTPPGGSALKITTSTTIFPAFDPAITDYVATTPSGALQVTVNAPAGTQVAVDGHPAAASTFTTPVTIAAGQSFPIVVTSAGTSKTYYVRCLPTDFPAWTTERPGTPQTEYYAFTPDSPIGPGTARHYLVIADNNGVPIWWYQGSDEPRAGIVLANGNIAWNVTNGVEEHKLNGTLVNTITPDKSDGATFDLHELQQLPNGDFLIMAEVFRGPVDLSAEGGSANGTAVDNVIEEIAPNGSLVWKWSTFDHIPVSETSAVWWTQFIQSLSLADPYHMNSVEADGDGFVVSFRHLDSVYRINKATGNIVWKLGGTHRAESLTFSGDAHGNFGGQHDARILPDGTLTLHDNSVNQSRPPRAVRYRIDTAAKTATLLEQVTDPEISSALCCGSARKESGGNWVMSWGYSSVVTELTPAGARVFRMKLTNPYFSYRVQPVPTGVLNRAALRTGMDAQFPR
ncbi:MAG: hypothetical protein JWN14_256 [Chthonomonadales bacterium]|nr:hypothetical protein [Chthonomonadales bacterium]